MSHPFARYLKRSCRKSKSIYSSSDHDGSVTASTASVEELQDASVNQDLGSDNNIAPTASSRRSMLARVRFDETLNQYHANTVMARDEIDVLWYDGAECNRMKKEYNTITRTVDRRNLSTSGQYIFALETVYRNSQRSNGKALTLKKEQQVQARLQAWSAEGNGLQFRVLQHLVRDKNQRKARKLDILRHYPRRIRNISKSQLALEVAERCLEISKPAVQFAIQLAKIPPPSQEE
eukprot:CAMPEP_0168724474 /NCGR_PEP_ID=MMETSP0724-20121128/3654_1 /TAXON_ID=265536 /ORGANISM="Amphiprora sp., Strain CCMP467" /LENGTH=234 /DNA_ID=CAMNT_0008771223 /DNA_START=21 /DNA_END=725 /DNA_ORIENTATION=-